MTKTVLTHKALLAALEQGKTSREIAEEHGITKAAVNMRRARLRMQATTIVAFAKPGVRQLVSREMDAIAELHTCIRRLTMLSDAYHEWLLDPTAADGSKYDVGPRATEVEVIYREAGSGVTKKATVQQLLDRMDGRIEVEAVERQGADPRIELRNTVQNISRTVGQIVELAALLADMKSLAILRDSILEELRQADPEVARRITSRLRHGLVSS